MKVIEIAQLENTTVHTIRYYTLKGLLSPIKNINNGYKYYSEKDQHRLKFILNARDLGFSINDIKNILFEADKGETACPLVRKIIEERLIETEKKFQETKALRKRMKRAISKWRLKPNLQPTGYMVCHLIEDFIGKDGQDSN